MSSSESLIYHLKTNYFQSEEKENQLVKLLIERDFGPNQKISFLENVSKLQANKDEDGTCVPLLSSEFENFIFSNKEKIQESITKVQNSTPEFKVGYFGYETLFQKYLLKTYDMKYRETIDNFLIRIALYIWKDKNNFTKFEKMYSSLRRQRYIMATPTLFNSGCSSAQLCSCFLVGGLEKDSIESIFDTIKQAALISKHAGGLGMWAHSIRCNESRIRGTNGKSNGIIPLLKTLESTVKYIDQGGGKRAGSLAVYLEPWHADIFDFLMLKRNTGADERRCRDLFLALWIPDLFMKKVLEDGDFYLFDPNTAPNLYNVYGKEFEELYFKYVDEKRYVKKIKARDIWDAILTSQIEAGVPYMLYKDKINECSNQKNIGVIKSSNLCTEIVEYSDEKETACCNLSSICLPKCLRENPFIGKLSSTKIEILVKENCSYCSLLKFYLEKNNIQYNILTTLPKEVSLSSVNEEEEIGKITFPQVFLDGELMKGGFTSFFENYLCPVFDFDLLAELVEESIENLNQVVDINNYPVKEASVSNNKHRPVGLGVQGLANVFSQMLESYDSPKARMLNNQIFECIYFYSLKKSNELAKISEKPYESFNGSPLSRGIFHFELFDSKNKGFLSKDKSRIGNLGLNWESLRKSIIQYGVVNSLLVALMPTASTSQINGNVESFEPLSSNFYLRRCNTGEHYCISNQLRELLEAQGQWNADIQEKLILGQGSIAEIKEICPRIRSTFKTVFEYPSKSLLEMARDRQMWIDQSQSMNLFLQKPDSSLLTKLHLYGWKLGLKTGSYYCRSRPAVTGADFFLSADKLKEIKNSNANTLVQDDENECLNCGA